MVRKSFGNLKPKDDKKASKSIDKKEARPLGAGTAVTSPDFDCLECGKPFQPYYNDEGLITSICAQCYVNTNTVGIEEVEEKAYIPKSERLLAIYDMLTDKSFPRKGAGKSTKVKILDAIITAAIDKKLKLQGA